jgi:hypothetical protein
MGFGKMHVGGRLRVEAAAVSPRTALPSVLGRTADRLEKRNVEREDDPMGTSLRSELQRSAALLRTLRDEVRVQLHLGGLEAQAQWRLLEPRLESAFERAKVDASEASRRALHELTRTLRKLRETLH